MMKLFSLLSIFISFSIAQANDTASPISIHLQSLTSVNTPINWTPVARLSLYNEAYPTFHPQGIKVNGNDVYLTTVEGDHEGFGKVIKYQMNTEITKIDPVDQLKFDAGEQNNLNHAGGMDGNADSLYIPLAAYREKGPAEVLKVDLQKFGTYSILGSLNDHIGALIAMPGQLKLFSWGSNGLYAAPLDNTDHFARSMSVSDRIDLTRHGWQFQDCKYIGNEEAVCSAKKGLVLVSGEVDLIRFKDQAYEIVSRLRVPHVNANGSGGGRRPLSYNSMDVQATASGIRLFFVPHDDAESTLFVYDLSI